MSRSSCAGGRHRHPLRARRRLSAGDGAARRGASHARNPLASRIDGALAARRPCNARIEAGIIRPDRADSYYVVDIAATCTPNERGRQEIKEPLLIVEILSPGTERHDRLTKVPVYRGIGSVAEILLIDSETIYAEVLRREGDRWIAVLVRGPDAVLRLASVDLAVMMAELYNGIDIDPDAEP